MKDNFRAILRDNQCKMRYDQAIFENYPKYLMMRPTYLRQTSAIFSSLAIALFLLGCSSDTAPAARENSNLKPLAVLYGRYLGEHRGQPPASEDELKTYVRSRSPKDLESLNVQDADSIFISSRDQQPYKFVFANNSPPDKPSVFAYEAIGVGGKHFVANSLGQIEEVDEAKLKQLVASP